jgi:hypothetical protein
MPAEGEPSSDDSKHNEYQAKIFGPNRAVPPFDVSPPPFASLWRPILRKAGFFNGLLG